MQNKLFLIFLLAGMIIILGGLWLFFNNEKQEDSQEDNIPAEIVEAFQNELVTRGVEKQGQPIEGFDAFLLMQAFPGLHKEDFDGVLAFEGKYTYENGEVVYERTADQFVTSAEQTVSNEGYRILLENVSVRLGVSVQNEGAAMDIIEELEKTTNGPPSAGESITIKGEITCLPKTGPGPHTMECAIGLKGEDGNHYALKNLFVHDPEYRFSTTGLQVEVTGILSAEEMLGPDGNKYDIVGVIEVDSIEER